MDPDDVFAMIALIAPAKQVLDWDQGGGSVVTGWAKRLQKLHKERHGPKRR